MVNFSDEAVMNGDEGDHGGAMHRRGHASNDIEHVEQGHHKPAHEEKKSYAPVMALLYVVCAVEGLDLQLLPSSFKVLESQLGMTPTMLGSLGMGQALCQATAGPIWGALADRGVSRRLLLSSGAVAWGTVAVCLGFTSNFSLFFALRCLDGAALACLGPICQSIIADVASPSARGMSFGLIDFSIKIGSCISAFAVTAVSDLTFNILGFTVQGWRVAFVCVGMLSFLICCAVLVIMEDPPRTHDDRAGSHHRNEDDGEGEEEEEEAGGREGEGGRREEGQRRRERGKRRQEPEQESLLQIIRYELALLSSYFQIPSFLVILAQGVFGMIPWAALSFLTMYFQYIGMSNVRAGAIGSTITLFCAFGAVTGGLVADRLTKWSQFHGRPLTAQISVLNGILLFVLLLYFIPRAPQSFQHFIFAGAVFGISASWAGVGCNSPLLLELVEASSRARVVALLNAINGAAAAMLGGPMVGMLAEWFGYTHPHDVRIEDMAEGQRTRNLNALSQAIALATIPPWVICLLAFTALHFTYRRDVRRMRGRSAWVEKGRREGEKGGGGGGGGGGGKGERGGGGGREGKELGLRLEGKHSALDNVLSS